jgi:hypothetical protein
VLFRRLDAWYDLLMDALSQKAATDATFAALRELMDYGFVPSEQRQRELRLLIQASVQKRANDEHPELHAWDQRHQVTGGQHDGL